MKDYVRAQANAMKKLNDLTLPGEIVVFGSTYMSNFPIYELINRYTLENAVYNRSIKGLTIAEAAELLDDCIFNVRPSKLFISLGEEDTSNPNAISEYSLLVSKTSEKLPNCTLYLICLSEDSEFAKNFNANIKRIANGKNIKAIELVSQGSSDIGLYKAQFKQLSCFFRRRPITMSDAFHSAII